MQYIRTFKPSLNMIWILSKIHLDAVCIISNGLLKAGAKNF